MWISNSDYVHGTDPEEQKRLSRLNALLNGNSLGALELREGERVLDVGSGLGQFTRLLARKVGPRGKVLGIERSEAQLAEALTRNGRPVTYVDVPSRYGHYAFLVETEKLDRLIRSFLASDSGRTRAGRRS